MNISETIPGHVRVDFGCADVGVAEQFLDHAKIGAVFEEVGGKSVSQHVRRDVSRNAGARDAFFDP